MPSSVFAFTDANSGKITKKTGFSTTYTAATGSSNCQCGRDTNPPGFDNDWLWYAFFQFDTSALPNNAIILSADILVILAAVQPGGAPDTRAHSFYVGDFIGAALNGTAAEFTGGNLVQTISDVSDSTYYDIGTTNVNVSGNTDVCIRDESVKGAGDDAWGRSFNTTKVKCELRVNYGLPGQKLPLLGVGR